MPTRGDGELCSGSGSQLGYYPARWGKNERRAGATSRCSGTAITAMRVACSPRASATAPTAAHRRTPTSATFPARAKSAGSTATSYEGADRACPACNSPQSARARNCTHCGSVLDGAAEVRGVSDAPAAPRTAPAKRRHRRRIWPFVLSVLVIFGFGIWWRCVRSQSAEVVVSPTAHALAHLRIAGRVTVTVARLATGSGGSPIGWAGFAPAG